jgi:hypothetical protein
LWQYILLITTIPTLPKKAFQDHRVWAKAGANGGISLLQNTIASVASLSCKKKQFTASIVWILIPFLKITHFPHLQVL